MGRAVSAVVKPCLDQRYGVMYLLGLFRGVAHAVLGSRKLFGVCGPGVTVAGCWQLRGKITPAMTICPFFPGAAASVRICSPIASCHAPPVPTQLRLTNSYLSLSSMPLHMQVRNTASVQC